MNLRPPLPHHRARRRRRHAHALESPEGAPRDRRPHDARPCARGSAGGRRRRRRGRRRTGKGRRRGGGDEGGAGRERVRPGGEAGHRPCGPRRARRRSRAATTRSWSPMPTSRSFAGTTLSAMRAMPRRGRGPGRARLRSGRSGRLRPADRARRPPLGDSRGQGRDRRREGGPAVQRGPDRLRRRRGAVDAGGGEAAQCAERILPHRSRRDRQRARAASRAPSKPTRPRSWASTTGSQLAAAEAAMQARLRRRAMIEGATLVAPETVFLSCDTKIGRDVLIEPHVSHRPGRHDRGRRRRPRLLASRGRARRGRGGRSGPSRG